ncbi:MAG: OadG family protein [Muribaculaceae bacterium]|nr:OadG family protein [Muribaculaceae bacterium]
MLRNLAALIILVAIAAGSLTGHAREASEKQDPVATEFTVGEQIVAEPQTAPSEPVNYVEESELARKMQQAKKAHDAETYDSYGGGITIIAMCIVIGALIVLSILFYIFGNISSWFLTHKKKKATKGLKPDGGATDVDVTPDSGEVIAAISAALAQHFAVDHDMQDTILTIRKLRKAYSPWNSKIYNMRALPEVSHNHPKLRK